MTLDFEFEELDPLGISGEERGHQTRIWEDAVGDYDRIFQTGEKTAIRIGAIYYAIAEEGELTLHLHSIEVKIDEALVIDGAQRGMRLANFIYTGGHWINTRAIDGIQVVASSEGEEEVSVVEIMFPSETLQLDDSEMQVFLDVSGAMP